MVGSIDGIVSGMDTGSLVTQLMQLERAPQLRLQSQRAASEKVLTALRALNTKIAAIGDAAKLLTTAKGWQPATVTSSDPSRVSVAVTGGATPATFSFTVGRLAAAASAVSSGTVASTGTVVTTGPLVLAKGTSALGIGDVDTATAILSAGAHTLTVTQSSAGATKTGATPLAASTTITAGVNDSLRVTVGGVVTDVTLTAGTYDPAQLAAELTAQLGGRATATAGADGRLAITTTAEGSAATLQVGGRGALDAGALTALGLTADATALVGVDGKVQLDGDTTREVTVTDVRAGAALTVTTAAGDRVSASLVGGLRTGTATLSSVGAAGGSTLAQVVSGINAAGIGVTAAAVQVSPGAYRLQVTSTTAGASSSVSLGTGSFPAGTSTLGTLSVLTEASDAVLTVGTGAGAYEVRRSSNTISDLVAGVTLTLAKADPTTAVTVEIATDTAGLSKQVSALTDAVNAALAEIDTLTKYDPVTKKGGLLVGDGMLRRLRTELMRAVTDPVATSTIGSPGTNGVSAQRDGTVKVDSARFLEAWTADPAAVQSLFTAVAQRVGATVERITDRTDGLVPGAIRSKESQVRGISERISAWDDRLALREIALRRQFTAMEKALGSAQQQGQWLAGQIAGLPSWGG